MGLPQEGGCAQKIRQRTDFQFGASVQGMDFGLGLGLLQRTVGHATHAEPCFSAPVSPNSKLRVELLKNSSVRPVRNYHAVGGMG